jgi:hypothetical protein
MVLNHPKLDAKLIEIGDGLIVAKVLWLYWLYS